LHFGYFTFLKLHKSSRFFTILYIIFMIIYLLNLSELLILHVTSSTLLCLAWLGHLLTYLPDCMMLNLLIFCCSKSSIHWTGVWNPFRMPISSRTVEGCYFCSLSTGTGGATDCSQRRRGCDLGSGHGTCVVLTVVQVFLIFYCQRIFQTVFRWPSFLLTFGLVWPFELLYRMVIRTFAVQVVLGLCWRLTVLRYCSIVTVTVVTLRYVTSCYVFDLFDLLRLFFLQVLNS